MLNQCGHHRNLRHDLNRNLLGLHAARDYRFWRLAAFRHISEASDNQSREPLFEGWRGRNRLPGIQAALESLNGSGVGEIEMLENFGGTPLPFRMTTEVVRLHAGNRGGDDILESLQVEIHRKSFRFD